MKGWDWHKERNRKADERLGGLTNLPWTEGVTKKMKLHKCDDLDSKNTAVKIKKFNFSDNFWKFNKHKNIKVVHY